MSTPSASSRVAGVGLHVERLDVRRVASDHDRLVEVLRETSSLRRRRSRRRTSRPSHPPCSAGSRSPRRSVMRGKGCCHRVSSLRRCRARGFRALGRRARARGSTTVHDELLGELDSALELQEGDLRLDHPELGQVAARLRLLGAEGRAEAVDLAERRPRRLDVELARLR